MPCHLSLPQVTMREVQGGIVGSGIIVMLIGLARHYQASAEDH